ncbi:MAG: GNAT family N-acetyltransferase [Myxococcales bacterium]|nr:GNAT family N-acetyltransferase [Myxococcales bacterium]
MREIELAACELFRAMPDVYERYVAMPTPEDALLRGIEARTLWVVESGGRVAGFLLAAPVDGAFHIDELDVDPLFGRRGLGTKLVEYACEFARDQRYPACTLVTMTSVRWNAPWYRALGFRELTWDELTPTLKVMRARERERGLDRDRVVMRKEL